MKTVIVMPAYNEEGVVGEVIENVKKNGFKHILVVDDGSSDKTFQNAKKAGATVIRHILNRGLGGALGTGIKGALMIGADIVVTFDSDGQHDAKEINKIIEPIKKRKCDAVIGTRTHDKIGMPFMRRMFNKVGNIITYLLFGVLVSDSQSGFRAFNKKAASKINIKTNHMEVSSEIIREIGRNKIKFKEVPIKAIYTDYSMSKGQNFFLGLKTLWKLIIHRLLN